MARRSRRLTVPVGFDVLSLGPRERQVLAGLERGQSLRAIAVQSGTSYEAVKKAAQRLHRRFHAYMRSPEYKRALREDRHRIVRRMEALVESLADLYASALGVHLDRRG